MLEIGQKTPDYPHGYGFCQCGCGRRTNFFYFGEYSRYANARHHPYYKVWKSQAYLAQITREREAAVLPAAPKAKGYPDPPSSVKIGDVVIGFENGWGCCQCGCDGRTNIYKKGHARRFIMGHSSKTPESRSAQSLRAAVQAREAEFSPYVRFGRSVRGTHLSPKLGRPVNFMSLYEKKAFEVLDLMHIVSGYEEQPFDLPYFYEGNRFTYIPDVLVYLADSRKVLLEIKPESRLKSPRVQAKHAAAQAFCRNKGMFFMVVTETQLFKEQRIEFGELSAGACGVSVVAPP